MDILVVMGIGILAGRFLVSPKMKKLNEKISFLCTLLLIFSMGVMLGQKDNFLEELSTLGITSFFFFLIPTILSVLVVYILTRRLGERKEKKAFKEVTEG